MQSSSAGAAVGRAPSNTLTKREREVTTLVARGWTDRAIAARLAISQHTVGRHLKNIFAKLEIDNLGSLTLYALREGMIGLQCGPELAEHLTHLAGIGYEDERLRRESSNHVQD